LNNNNLGDIFIMQKNVNIAILALIMFFRVTVNLSGMEGDIQFFFKRKKTSFSNIPLDKNYLTFEDLELEIADIQNYIDKYKNKFDLITQQNRIINIRSLAEKIDDLHDIFIQLKLKLEKIEIDINKNEETKLIETLKSSASVIIDLFESICLTYENHLGCKKFKDLRIKSRLNNIIVSYKNLVKMFYFSDDQNDLIFNIFKLFLNN
jgi:hypothetical protein